MSSCMWRGFAWEILLDNGRRYLYGQPVNRSTYFRIELAGDYADWSTQNIVREHFRAFLETMPARMRADLPCPIEILTIIDEAAYDSALNAYEKNL